MNTVADILEAKGNAIWSIHPGATVFDALKLMSDKEIGAVIVLDETAAVRGILSERDYARKIPLQGKVSRETAVSMIMTPVERMHTVAPATTVESTRVVRLTGWNSMPAVDSFALA